MSNEVQKHVLAKQDYMNGMKYKDIAEKYGVKLATVKSWKTREKWPSRNKKSTHTNDEKVCIQKKDAENKKQAIAEEVESVIENPDLTDKQRLFCLHYSRTFNATSAYQKAYGGDYTIASGSGSRLLANAKIKAEVLRLKRERMSKELLTTSDIFERYMQIAFADITDYVEFGNKDIGSDDKEITVSYVNIKNSDRVDGTLLTEVSQGREGVKVKLPDRMKALDWLADHMSMATDEQKARLEYVKAQTERIKENDGNTGEGVVIMDDIPDESKSD